MTVKMAARVYLKDCRDLTKFHHEYSQPIISVSGPPFW